MHLTKRGQDSGVMVRAFLREGTACEVVDLTRAGAKAIMMTRVDPAGLFELWLPRRKSLFAYQLRAKLTHGEIRQFYDAYSFLPTLG